MRFLDLGVLEIETAGRHARPGGRRPSALLAALLLHLNQRVSIDLLLDAIWGDEIPETAPTNLENLIWRLRRVLEPDRPRGHPSSVLVNDSGGYRMMVARETVDSARFEQLSFDVVDLLATDQADRALQVADQALDLWRGDPFRDVAERSWTAAPVARLQELNLQVQERRIDALLAVGRAEQAATDLGVILAGHPFRERLWWQQMLALHRCGRTEEALQTFAIARRTLVEELGLEPGSDLVDLQRRILQQDVALDASRPAVAARDRVPEVHLPRTRRLIGRDADQAAIRTALAKTRLLTVAGPAGSGKTALAIAVAQAAAEHYPDGVWFADLSVVDSDGDLWSAVAAALEIGTPSGGSTAEALMAYARDRRTLLVLDNCEPVLDGVVGVLSRLVTPDHELTVLATCRQPLGHEDEALYWLAPLAVAPLAGGTGPVPAEALFCRRAKLELSALSTGQAAAVSRICAAVDGLPLAIELAAALMPAFPLPEIAALVERDPTSLAALGRSHRRDHGTMAAAINRSYRLLSADEQAVYRRLAVLPGSYGRELAEAVAGTDLAAAVPPILARLVLRSLLTVERAGSRARFAQLVTIRSHASQELAAAGDRGPTERRRDAWVKALIDRRPPLGRPEEADWYAELTAQLPSVRATLQHCLVTEPEPLGAQVAAQLFGYWFYSGRYEEGTRWAELAAAQPGIDRSTEVANRLTVSSGLLLQGLTDAGRAEFRRAVVRMEPGPAPVLLAELFLSLACLFSLADDRAAAREALAFVQTAAIDLAEPGLAAGHEAVACLVEASSVPPEVTRARAQISYQRALAVENLLAAWLSCSSVNSVALARRDVAEGLTWSRRLLALQTRLGAETVLQELETYGAFLALDGRYEHAVRVLSATRAQARRSGSPWPRNSVSEELLDAARRRLSGADFDQAWSLGPQLSRADLIAEL